MTEPIPHRTLLRFSLQRMNPWITTRHSYVSTESDSRVNYKAFYVFFATQHGAAVVFGECHFFVWKDRQEKKEPCTHAHQPYSVLAHTPNASILDTSHNSENMWAIK